MTLNQALLEHAGIQKEVVIVGNLDHLEVWDRDRWSEDQRALNAEVA